MLILAIETSCDETAICLAEFSDSGAKIRENLISSQIKIHAKFGGVVPSLASREHVKNIFPLLKIAMKNSDYKEINTIAITNGPGLMPALLIGTNVAKTLSWLWNKPLVPINHLEGHIYSTFLEPQENDANNYKFRKLKFPILNLIVSGGHTQLTLMESQNKFQNLGITLDDAAGEAFDKAAKILRLGYPGGPLIATASNQLKANNKKLKLKELVIKLPRPMINSKNLNFSFSGLKTATLYLVQKLLKNHKLKDIIPAVANEFQNAIIETLVKKTIEAAKKYQPKTIALSGGVAANKKLREALEKEAKKNKIIFIKPETKLCGDNALMIGAAAYFRTKNKKNLAPWNKLIVNPNLNF